jgi:hypothetical protein
MKMLVTILLFTISQFAMAEEEKGKEKTVIEIDPTLLTIPQNDLPKPSAPKETQTKDAQVSE